MRKYSLKIYLNMNIASTLVGTATVVVGDRL
jgi:hypothetical protein